MVQRLVFSINGKELCRLFALLITAGAFAGFVYMTDSGYKLKEHYGDFKSDYPLQATCKLTNESVFRTELVNNRWVVKVSNVTVNAQQAHFIKVLEFYYPDSRLRLGLSKEKVENFTDYFIQSNEIECVTNKKLSTLTNKKVKQNIKKGNEMFTFGIWFSVLSGLITLHGFFTIKSKPCRIYDEEVIL